MHCFRGSGGGTIRDFFYILKVVKFSTPKLYIFVFLVSRSMLVFCLFVHSCTSNFSAIWRLSPLPVTGLQILAYARRSGPLSREGSLSCHTYCDTGTRFIWSHPKDWHLRLTVGFEPPSQGLSDQCSRRSNHCTTQATFKDHEIVCRWRP
jgi:hypothetical protein